MATYYFRSVGTAWNNTSSWSTSSSSGSSAGVIPTSSDSVIFDVNSAATCPVSTTPGVCLTLDTTGYAGTITLNVSLTVSGNITLGAATAIGGSASFICNASASLKSNGNTFITCTFVLYNRSGNNNTYTLLDDWTFIGTFSTQAQAGGLTHTINGNNIYCRSNLSINAGSFSASSLTTGTTVINITGVCTMSQSSNTSGGLGNSLVFNAPSLNIFLPATLCYRTGTIKYISGNLSGPSNIVPTGNFTVDMTNGGANSYVTPFSILSSYITNTITMVSDWYLTGVNVSVFNCTINGAYSLYTTGTIVSSSAGVLSGTAVLRLKGSSGQSVSSTSSIGIDISIEAGSNTVNISNLSYTPKSGGSTITYVSGTVNVTGTLTITGPNNITLNTSGVNWNNITFTGASYTITLNSSLIANGTITFGTNNYTFAGSYGFTTNSFVWNTTPATVNTGIVLAAGVTYTITNNLTLYSATIPTYLGLQSSTPGSVAYFVLNSGATQSVANVQTTDINSAAGQTIWVFLPGTLSNTTNWRTLSYSSLQYSSTFVN